MKKNILVTGGAGFIGSHVVDGYIDAGHKVTVIDDLSTGNKQNINPKADFLKMDIRNKKVEELFQKKKFDVVNHHAAQIDVRKSVLDPIHDAEINILGSLNLIENAKKYNLKKFIFISSGGVMYGECSKGKNENTKSEPLSPYGLSKLSFEHYVSYYSKLFKIPYVILRYGNVYGPRQNPKGEAGVVAIFSNQMIANEQTYIFGDGKQKRDYVHVEDIKRSNLKALTKSKNEIFNIGTGKSVDVNVLHKKMASIFEYTKKVIHKHARPGELQASRLDISKAAKGLGWKPRLNMDKGLKQTIDYYKNRMKK
ncbi:NAD-dependent epimerase/dehydratase family protein [bacterium]